MSCASHLHRLVSFSFHCVAVSALLLTSMLVSAPLASAAVPSFVVTVNSDTTNGSPGNCTNQSLSGATPDANCSLRDALAASETGGGSITFSATVFGAAQSVASRTITLANGSLNIPSNTTIVGPTSGTGATLTNLVIVNTTNAAGNNQDASLFAVASSVTNAAIGGLTITSAATRSTSEGGGILNHGSLTLTNCTISNNVSGSEYGGGIYNDGTLVVADSTISGNTTYSDGGGIYNSGTLTLNNSTIAGNTGLSYGSGLYTTGTLTVSNSTFVANASPGNLGTTDYSAGVWIQSGQTSFVNSILAYSSPIDCGVENCPSNGSNGNVVVLYSLNLASLGNYGGPTQTAPPLPGSPAICAGAPTSASKDQRGLPRSTNYGNTTCIDSGAVQTKFLAGL
jgi:large repetitive protein